MTNNGSFSEKTLRRIRSNQKSESSKKKRRLSKIFLAIDAVVILILLLFFYNRKGPEHSYYSTKINYKELLIRFSISRERTDKDYLFSVSMKSNGTSEKKFIFNNSIGKVTLYYKKEPVAEKIIGPGISGLNLLPGETKTFVENIDSRLLDNFISEKKGLIKYKKRSLIEFDKPKVQFDAEILLNIDEKLSSTIIFEHEVN